MNHKQPYDKEMTEWYENTKLKHLPQVSLSKKVSREKWQQA